MKSIAAADLLAVERGRVREATLPGHMVVRDTAGRVLAALGDAGRPTYFRSCAKPFQALATLRCDIASRFRLEAEHIAVIAGSHSGEAPHLARVREILDRAGVPEGNLQCGAHWPFYEPAAAALRRQMPDPIPLFNNCSGKHAGMLAAARALSAPLDGYLDLAHPVQQRVQGVFEEFTDIATWEIPYGTDGCSAPNPAVPLAAMAGAFARLVTSAQPEAAAVVEAMTRHPYLVGGTDRFDTRLMEATGGRLLAKGGAAGAHCTADVRSGLGLAVKLEGGDGTWIGAAVVGALAQLGWLTPAEVEDLAPFARPTLKNYRGREVGTVRPLFQLRVTDR